MALSIKTAEADRLARELSRLTGESITDVVTRSLAERLERLRRKRDADQNLPARLRQFAQRLANDYDTRPVTRKEWDAAMGDEQ